MPHHAAPLLALILAAACAAAQPQAETPAPAATQADDRAAAATDDAPPQLPERAGPTVALTLTGTIGAKADLDDAGDFSVARARAAVDLGMDLGERRALTLTLGAEHSWYDFDDATGLAATGDPFSRTFEAQLGARFSAPVNDRTDWFALGAVGLAAEDGADLSDAWVFTAGGGFVTRASPTFSWGLGLVVRTRPEDDALIVPIPQIRWAIDDRWTLASHRAGARLNYAHSDQLSYGLQAEYQSRSFRLDDDGPIPDGVATDRAVPVAFYAEYTPRPGVTLGASIGATLLHNVELIDDAGDKITDEDADPAAFFGLTARVAF